MFAICGLGNPGKKYSGTRHNVGFDLIDKIISNYNFKILKKDKQKEIYKGKIKNKNIYIIKPLTFMNLSGIPLGNFLNYYKIPIKNLLVVHDDIDLSLGKVKIKIGGGNGGHNGLLSVDKMIGKMYYRLRIGIGRPKSKDLVNKYVLKKFKNDEKKIIEAILDFSSDSIDLLLKNKELFLTKIYTFIQKI